MPKCVTKYCRNKARLGRVICHKCRYRRYVEKHPLKAAYYNLRKSAKRRGIQFKLTLAEFEHLAIKYDYQNHRGKLATSYTVDRIDPMHGYVVGNLQFLSNAENAAKAVADRKAALVQEKIHGHKFKYDIPF